MAPPFARLAGRVHEHDIDSTLLRDNPLSDPAQRPLWVYTPPGYDTDPERRYPVTYLLLGYAGTLPVWRNRTPYRQPVPELIDGIFARREAPPMILVFVDAWTATAAVSTSTRRAPAATTRTSARRSCRGSTPTTGRSPTAITGRIAGKSSGGFGAMITPMLRPDLFGAFATHSGDSLYEPSYIPHFAKAVRHLRAYDGDIFRWWDDFRSRVAFTKDEDLRLLELLGVSACFSPAPDGTPAVAVRSAHRRAPAGRSGSAGWPGTRCGWRHGTPTRCAPCGRSGSTPAPATNGSSTSARRPSATPSPRSALIENVIPSSCSTEGTTPSNTECHPHSHGSPNGSRTRKEEQGPLGDARTGAFFHMAQEEKLVRIADLDSWAVEGGWGLLRWRLRPSTVGGRSSERQVAGGWETSPGSAPTS